MKEQTKGLSGRLFMVAGICLLAVAAVVLICWQWGIHASKKQAANYVRQICALSPQPQSAVPEARRDNSMAILSIDGKDFAGILEMPGYGSSLPVCANWGEVSKYPCRLSGSIYDGTMQIGTTSQDGQYDFYREITVGDPVFFTDMEGNRFSYKVADIRYEKHADQTTLQAQESSLTIFIKNIYGFEYILIFCDVLN